MINKEEQVYSVNDLNTYIKGLFDNTITLKNICIKGQIINFSGVNRNGHLYFSLSDELSSIKVVIFKYDAKNIDCDLKDGDEVIIKGSVSSYPPSGTYQLIGKEIFPIGLSELLIKRKKLEEKLTKEGIFDNDHKLEIPKYPKVVGVITGKNSAAEKDIVTNIYRRYPACEVIVYHALVQGIDAPKDIINRLNSIKNENLDVIIIGRGGGGSEDLYAFDDELLVRTIYDYKIPIVSAVGHEINRSLIDLVSDGYASTPTGAAELVVPDKEQIIEDLSQIKSYLNSLINSIINELNNKLESLTGRNFFNNIILKNENSIEKIKNYKDLLNNLILNKLKDYEHELKNYKESIKLLNPREVLKKGYSVIFDKNEKVIKSINDIKDNEDIKVLFNDGYAIATIKERKNGK